MRRRCIKPYPAQAPHVAWWPSGGVLDFVLAMRTRWAGRNPSDAGFLRIPNGIMHSEESRRSSKIVGARGRRAQYVRCAAA